VIMMSDPATVHPTQRLSVARHAMLASGGHHVPVVEDGRFIGLITPTDLLRVLPPDAYARTPAALDDALDHVPVRTTMQEDVLTIPPTATVRDASERLAHGGFHSLPVVDAEGRLAGIVTTADILRALLAAASG
ncbi:MAG TPA: CBS domain-containing protein, partial [Nannocystaceae bacterium]|nr:CBS domain-containing protein [Nannocystaceae bacterium]